MLQGRADKKRVIFVQQCETEEQSVIAMEGTYAAGLG